MNRIVVRSRVGSDGMLHLTLPVGPGDAGEEVQVTVESFPLAKRSSRTPDEWKAWVRELGGSWQGDFERPPHQSIEERDTLQ